MIIELIDIYTLTEQKELFIDLVKKTFDEQYGINYSNIKYNKDTKQYEYEIKGKIYTFNELSDMTDIEELKKSLKLIKGITNATQELLD